MNARESAATMGAILNCYYGRCKERSTARGRARSAVGHVSKSRATKRRYTHSGTVVNNQNLAGVSHSCASPLLTWRVEKNHCWASRGLDNNCVDRGYCVYAPGAASGKLHKTLNCKLDPVTPSTRTQSSFCKHHRENACCEHFHLVNYLHARYRNFVHKGVSISGFENVSRRERPLLRVRRKAPKHSEICEDWR
jgi:hypothetical protein